jgi:hypothetical protein
MEGFFVLSSARICAQASGIRAGSNIVVKGSILLNDEMTGVTVSAKGHGDHAFY